MTPFRHILFPALLLGGVTAAQDAYAATCTNGGELNIIAAADSLSLTPTPATTFNFGEHVIVSAEAVGFSITAYAWSITGPTIKDYNDNLGTKESPSPETPWAWSTTPLQSSDLTAPTVGFYWTPLYSQLEPNDGPFQRNVRLTATKSTGGTCSVTVPFNVERNQTNIDRQAEDFYTSNHRAPTTTNPLFGHVIDEHIFWHQYVHNLSSFPIWTRFLAWHGEFIRRYDSWRALFGYRKVNPWYPGTPLPTGPMFDVDPALRLPYVPDDNRLPTYFTIAGGAASENGRRKLADYPTLDALNYAFEGFYHSQVHCAIGSHNGNTFATGGPGYGSMCKNSSPKDPMFWRWHGFIDIMYRNYCFLKPGACPVPSPPDTAAEPWMADNASDISNGNEPSTGNMTISPDIWNRTAPYTSDACVGPVDAYGNKHTTGGQLRRCGNNMDHQTPVAGVTNYLYGRLRNTRAGTSQVVYSEVAVYYALTSSALNFPADFTIVPESRQFIALNTRVGAVTSIGPVPWVPPTPPAGEEYTLYLRVLSVQATPPPDTSTSPDADVANNNNVVRRNITIDTPDPPPPPPEE